MKRRMLSVFLVLLLSLCLGVTAFATAQIDASTLLYDGADLLTASEEQELTGRLEEISSAYNTQVMVVTLASANGVDIEYLADAVYDENGFGYGAERNGVMLLVCMDPRNYYVLSNGLTGDAITVEDTDFISELIHPYMSDGFYIDAFTTYADECEYLLDGYTNGFPFDFVINGLIALVIGLVVGLIVALVLRFQLKSVHAQDRADQYVRSGSMQISNRTDLFLYRDVQRTRRETGSGGGSSSSRPGPSGGTRNVTRRSF